MSGLDQNATKLSYSTSRAKLPTIEAAVSTSKAHYDFLIGGVSNPALPFGADWTSPASWATIVRDP
jgi:hypothetical protein